MSQDMGNLDKCDQPPANTLCARIENLRERVLAASAKGSTLKGKAKMVVTLEPDLIASLAATMIPDGGQPNSTGRSSPWAPHGLHRISLSFVTLGDELDRLKNMRASAVMWHRLCHGEGANPSNTSNQDPSSLRALSGPQCRGYTKQMKRCKNNTYLGSEHCLLHVSQSSQCLWVDAIADSSELRPLKRRLTCEHPRHTIPLRFDEPWSNEFCAAHAVHISTCIFSVEEGLRAIQAVQYTADALFGEFFKQCPLTLPVPTSKTFEEDDRCCICWQDFTDKDRDTLAALPVCGHIFCLECVETFFFRLDEKKHVPTRCPMCRRDLLEGRKRKRDDMGDRTGGEAASGRVVSEHTSGSTQAGRPLAALHRRGTSPANVPATETGQASEQMLSHERREIAHSIASQAMTQAPMSTTQPPLSTTFDISGQTAVHFNSETQHPGRRSHHVQRLLRLLAGTVSEQSLHRFGDHTYPEGLAEGLGARESAATTQQAETHVSEDVEHHSSTS